MEAKDAEIKELLKKKEVDLEEMKKKLKEQERERQSELLKLQMEVNSKLHLTSNCDAVNQFGTLLLMCLFFKLNFLLNV